MTPGELARTLFVISPLSGIPPQKVVVTQLRQLNPMAKLFDPRILKLIRTTVSG